jgi:hypothetical protein
MEKKDWIPAFGTVEKVLIRVVWFWKAYSVRAGLDRDEVVVVTCPQPLERAPGHTPRFAGSKTRRDFSNTSNA